MFKATSINQVMSYILCLRLENNSPLKDLKPAVVIPVKKDEILAKMSLAAKRLLPQNDTRLLINHSPSFNFKEYQLSLFESNWLNELMQSKGESIMKPIYDARDSNDWHYLPIEKVLNPEVTSLYYVYDMKLF